jgi:deoxycytidylate deaminase
MKSAPVDAASGYRNTELVFGLAGALGSDLKLVSRTLADVLKGYDYDVEEITVSHLIAEIIQRHRVCDQSGKPVVLDDSREECRIDTFMNGGNEIRRHCNDAAAMAAAAIGEIGVRRGRAGGRPHRRAYILRSLKRPEEVNLLRSVYGDGFFLISLFTTEKERIAKLAKRFAKEHGETEHSDHYEKHLQEARRLAWRDDEEAGDFGQKLRDVFQLADLFAAPGTSAESEELFRAVDRFVRLILGDLSMTPLLDEQAMFHAFAASLASGALGRQVGAVIAAQTGELLGLGWNDVPRGNGGLYRAGEHYDERDITRDRDSTNAHADRIVEEILSSASSAGWFGERPAPSLKEARAALRKTRVMHLLEFGRTTHAEMEAIVSAARAGHSVRGARLFTTTFPCHECARLIITAGIDEVLFIEPYPKSQALELHSDAIGFSSDEVDCGQKDCTDPHRVELRPFMGIGPRRYADLFSMTTAAGIRRERKDQDGNRVKWSPATAIPSVAMLPVSYLDLEESTLYQFKRNFDAKQTPILFPTTSEIENDV